MQPIDWNVAFIASRLRRSAHRRQPRGRLRPPIGGPPGEQSPAAQQPVHDDRPSDECRADRPCNRNCRIRERVDGNGEAHHQKHEGRGQERHELPDRVERFLGPWGEAKPAAVVAERDARDGRGDDPGLVECVGGQVRAVGQDHRQAYLDQVVADAGQDARRGEARDRAKRRGDRHDGNERDDHL